MSALSERGGDGVRSVRAVDCLPEIPDHSFEGSTRTFSYYNDVYAVAVLFCAEGGVTFRGRELSASSGQIGLIQARRQSLPKGAPYSRACNEGNPDRSRRLSEDAARESGIPGGADPFRQNDGFGAAPVRRVVRRWMPVRYQSTPFEVQTRFVTALELARPQPSAASAPTSGASDGPRVAPATSCHARFAEPSSPCRRSPRTWVSAPPSVEDLQARVRTAAACYQNHLRLAQAQRVLPERPSSIRGGAGGRVR